MGPRIGGRRDVAVKILQWGSRCAGAVTARARPQRPVGSLVTWCGLPPGGHAKVTIVTVHAARVVVTFGDGTGSAPGRARPPGAYRRGRWTRGSSARSSRTR